MPKAPKRALAVTPGPRSRNAPARGDVDEARIRCTHCTQVGGQVNAGRASLDVHSGILDVNAAVTIALQNPITH